MKNGLQKAGLIIGPLLFFLILFFDFQPGKPEITRMAAVALLMAVFWVTDAIPMSATALIPMAFYPLLGIMKGKALAPTYFNSTIFLFLGGFMIAIAMENWNLHKRIALIIIRIIGGGPARIILGFMCASAFLSMWISNTATAIMMLPIGMAIVSQMEGEFGEGKTRQFAVGLMLGIAYACSTGGIATLVGTPPNLAFKQIFVQTFPGAAPVSFGQWIIMAFPLSVVMILLIWFLLTRVFFRFPRDLSVKREIVDSEYRELGPMAYEEIVVLAVFSLTALLWIFRKNLNFGFVQISGWSNLLAYPKLVDDGTVAMTMALILFFIPVKSRESERACILGINTVQRLPWNIVLLFGGGFALARGFKVTGLSAYIGGQLEVLAGVHPLALIAVICFTLTFLTELTSNTATTQMILPILAAVGVATKTNPLLFMIPATLSASCAFMLPIATPPNAIVFGSGKIKIMEMARVGIVLNLIGIPIVTLSVYFIGTFVFDINPGVFPDWAVITPK